MSNSRAYFQYTRLDGRTLGAWVDMDLVDDWEDLADQLEAETGEPTPEGAELICVDVEGLCSVLYSSPGFFDMESWPNLRDADGDTDAKEAYVHLFGGWDESDFQDRYRGEWDSWVEMAEEFVADTGYLDNVPDHIVRYFDVEAFARDLRLGGGMAEHNGHFFWAS